MAGPSDDIVWTAKLLKEHYDQRFLDLDKAVLAALTAQEKATASALESTRDAISKAKESNEKRFAAQEKAVEVAFQSSKEAITKSEIAVEKRADAVYVSLTKLSESLGGVMPRAEAEQRYKAIDEKISVTNTAQVEKIDNLRTRFERTEGSGAGKNAAWGYLIGGVGLLGAVIAIVSSGTP